MLGERCCVTSMVHAHHLSVSFSTDRPTDRPKRETDGEDMSVWCARIHYSFHFSQLRVATDMQESDRCTATSPSPSAVPSSLSLSLLRLVPSSCLHLSRPQQQSHRAAATAGTIKKKKAAEETETERVRVKREPHQQRRRRRRRRRFLLLPLTSHTQKKIGRRLKDRKYQFQHKHISRALLFISRSVVRSFVRSVGEKSVFFFFSFPVTLNLSDC